MRHYIAELGEKILGGGEISYDEALTLEKIRGGGSLFSLGLRRQNKGGLQRGPGRPLYHSQRPDRGLPGKLRLLRPVCSS